jgi:hypothetical protein
MTEEKKHLKSVNRKDKHFVIGSWIIHYIHYYPHSYSPAQWGFSAYNFKGLNIDFYFGKHVIVWTFREYK